MITWIPVSLEENSPLVSPFLTCDKRGYVSLGFGPFDFYDSAYWYPFPTLPAPGIETNYAWIPVSLDAEFPKITPFIILDEFEAFHVAGEPVDFYHAVFWSPLPVHPMKGIITNDACVGSLMATVK